MKNAFVVVVLSLFSLIIVGKIIASPQDVIIIKEIQKDKEPVSFTHKSHGAKFLIGCPMCHHNNSKDNEQKCSQCHHESTNGKTLNLKEAFHQQCRGCHQKNHGPVTCGACHHK